VVVSRLGTSGAQGDAQGRFQRIGVKYLGLTRLALANDFGGGLEDTHQFLGNVGVAAEDPLFGLPHHLLHSRYKGVQFFPQPFEGGLLHHVR
jgi:hypothetical protein